MSFQDLQSNASKTYGRSRNDTGNASVAAGIFQIKTAVSNFRRLVDGIGTAKDTPEHRQKLHSTMQRILQLVKETKEKLNAVTDYARNDNVDQSKKIADAKLAKDFRAILEDFMKLQKLAKEHETAYAPSLPPSSLPTSSAYGEDVNVDTDKEGQALLREQKRQEILLLDNEVAFNEAIIEEREQGIKDIQDQIAETNEIFRDLAVLVHEQGVTIDDIDSNIEGSYSVTSQAKTQLAKASKSVKSRSSWCWWVLIVFVLVFVIVLLVLII